MLEMLSVAMHAFAAPRLKRRDLNAALLRASVGLLNSFKNVHMAYQRWLIVTINSVADKYVFWLRYEVLTCLYEILRFCSRTSNVSGAKQVPVALENP
jgi:hypothetical protein